MRIFTVLIAIFINLAAVAGPEDHKDAQTCYYLENEENSLPGASIPTQICLESLSIDTSLKTIEVYSYFFPHLFKNLKLDSFARKNEDFIIFQSTSILLNQVIGSDLEKVSLSISGLVSNQGEIDLKRLTIMVEQTFSKTYVEFPVVKYVYWYSAY